MRGRCPSDYRMGDENDPRSPWYEEPPEGLYQEFHDAVEVIEERLLDELITVNEEGFFLVPVDSEEWAELLEQTADRIREGLA